MRNLDYKPLSAVALNANQASAAIDAQNLIRLSAQAIVAGGTSVGNLQIQVSNDKNGAMNGFPFIPTNWSNLGAAVALAAGGIFLIASQETCYRWVRVIFTDGSGGTNTGNVTVNLDAIGF